MSVYLYDESLITKLKGWTEHTNMHIYSPSDTRTLYETIADEGDDTNIKLPILSLQRQGYTILNTNKKPLTYDGLRVDEVAVTETAPTGVTMWWWNNGRENVWLPVDPTKWSYTQHKKFELFEPGKLVSVSDLQLLNAIPIQIDYQIDIYTRTLKEADLYCRDLVFNIINHCKVPITIPFNGVNYEHHGHIRLAPNVEDNSGIAERMDFAQFTRYTLNINIDDAYLWSAPIRDPRSMEGIIIKPLTKDMDPEGYEGEKVNIKLAAVEFNANGGYPTPKPQSVEVGTKATKPDDPAREGYTFDSWYDGDEEWDWRNFVYEDLTLTAHWIQV